MAKPKTEGAPVYVRFPPEVMEEIEKVVKEEGYYNRSELIRQAVREWLELHRENKALPKQREIRYPPR